MRRLDRGASADAIALRWWHVLAIELAFVMPACADLARMDEPYAKAFAVGMMAA